MAGMMRIPWMKAAHVTKTKAVVRLSVNTPIDLLIIWEQKKMKKGDIIELKFNT